MDDAQWLREILERIETKLDTVDQRSHDHEVRIDRNEQSLTFIQKLAWLAVTTAVAAVAAAIGNAFARH